MKTSLWSSSFFKYFSFFLTLPKLLTSFVFHFIWKSIPFFTFILFYFWTLLFQRQKSFHNVFALAITSERQGKQIRMVSHAAASVANQAKQAFKQIAWKTRSFSFIPTFLFLHFGFWFRIQYFWLVVRCWLLLNLTVELFNFIF